MSSGQAGLPGPALHRPLLAPVRSVCTDGKSGADTHRTDATQFTFLMYIFCWFFFFFSVKCPSSSITYKHDLY